MSTALVINIFSSPDIKKEYENVDELLMFLKESCWLQEGIKNTAGDPEDLESAFFAKATADIPDASNIPNDLLQSKSHLKQLVFYLFERRFGWSEHDTLDEGSKKLQEPSFRPSASNSSPHHRFRSGTLHISEESRIKKMLNTKLDELIALFETEETISCQILDAYAYALIEARSLPVVRSQLFCHIFNWLTTITTDEMTIVDNVFQSVKSIIIAGVTDVWSAIRNNTVTRMMALLESLSVDHLQDTFFAFTEICDDTNSTWQAKEGAIMAIANVIQCFKLTIADKSALLKEGPGDAPGGTVICRKFGKHFFLSLPSFISEPLQKILYKLLSNSQLSIKEHANRAFYSFLLRSDFSQILKSFKEVLLYLARGAVYGKEKGKGDWKFTDANKADGYIKAAEFLIKQVPTDYILHNWHLCFATISHYLMHPASTVRQAASSVIKYLVAKQTPKLVMPNLVAQNLVAGWKTDIASLKEPFSSRDTSPNAQKNSVRCIEKKNNWDVDVTELWEWREGRLLAYELILKYLITNHIHYTFPAYTLTRAVVSRNSFSERKNISSEHKFSVSHNFGSRRGRGFSRHEALSRSLTMESDPTTQRYISSLIEKEKTKNQTQSLLEIMKRSEGESSHMIFDELESRLRENVCLYSSVTTASIKKLEDFSEECASLSKPPVIGPDPVPFGRILTQIFAQTLECMADTRWELRRMAHQVFPLISETIRFYDAKILENLWEKHLSADASKLGFGACVSLKYSLEHVAKLVKYFENPPGFWKDIDRCRVAAKSIVDSINDRLPGLLEKTAEIVFRPCFDRLTIISMEIILLSVIHFPQQLSQQCLISKFVKKSEMLFMQAYPQNPYARYLRSTRSEPVEEFQSSCDVLLSCAPKNASTETRAQKVLHAFFVDVQRLLPAFLRCSNFEDIVHLLPIMLIEISSLIELSTDVQPLMQACHVLLREDSLKSEGSRSLLSTSSSKMVLNFACEEICHILQTKDTEIQLVRQFLDILLLILRMQEKDANFRTVFAAITSKMASENDILSVVHGNEDSDDQDIAEPVEDELLRIRMLSNDISQSPIEELRIVTEDDQEDSPRDLPESQALSKTFDLNSNYETSDELRSVSPLERADSPMKDDYDSDWDSWEEEDEDASQMRAVFGTFLRNMQHCGGNGPPKDSIFNQRLQALDFKDRKLIESLIAQEASSSN
ncbi:uncharacterized protein LOC135690531 isoform X2 [Rhopilema esculentum]|uniref:uncharacterized protein LOC135690531 isoform X2 n=1 Tax=Rhopilema esculentum TaxID=499914 RepID=UPI0031CE9555